MRMLALAALLLLTMHPAGAAVSHDPRLKALRLSGIIGTLDHCTAATLLARHPEITMVHIDSRGGDAWAGAQLGRLFGEAGLTAVIPPGGRALSAAGIAALGARHVSLSGPLGLHAPYSPTPGAPHAATLVAEATAEMRNVLEMAGLPPDHLRRALATGPTGMVMIPQHVADSRHHRIPPDRDRVLRVAAACSALASLLGSPAPEAT